MAGADGVIYETHPTPEKAYSDAQQTVSFYTSAEMVRKLNILQKLKTQDFNVQISDVQISN